MYMLHYYATPSIIARSVGMNSSLLLWNAALPVYSALYEYLLGHYAAVTAVVYKFDHYLEMMLYKHASSSSAGAGSSSNRGGGSSSSTAALSEPDTQLEQQVAVAVAVAETEIQLSVLNTMLLCKDDITVPQCGYLQDYCPAQVVDYFTAQRFFRDSGNTSVRDSGNGIPAIVCFPLQPKPHEVKNSEAWVATHWQ